MIYFKQMKEENNLLIQFHLSLSLTQDLPRQGFKVDTSLPLLCGFPMLEIASSFSSGLPQARSLYSNFTIVSLRFTKVKLLVKAAPRHFHLSRALRSAHVRWGHTPRPGGTRPAAVPFTLDAHSPSCSAAALPGLLTLRSQVCEAFKDKKGYYH